MKPTMPMMTHSLLDKNGMWLQPLQFGDNDPCTDYANLVANGDIIAGPHVRNAARRHLRDLEKADDRGLAWDLDSANRVQRFFQEMLFLSGGQFEDKPFTLVPWQSFVLGSIFGWKRKKDGFRRFRRAYIETAKGSGKSPLAAGIGLYMFTSDNEASAQVYAAGAKKEQAEISFNDACFMVEKSPRLAGLIKMLGQYPRRKSMSYVSSKNGTSVFYPISSDSRQSGHRPSSVLADEVHEMGRDGFVLNMLEEGFKYRQQPLMFMITNSGFDRQSVCWEQHSLAVKACSSSDDPMHDSTFGYVCAVDEGEEEVILDRPDIWVKTNPSLPVLPTEHYLSEESNTARNLPARRNEILRLNFCVWTGANSSWVNPEAWQSCQHNFTPEWMQELEDFECFGGLDLSKKNDLTSFVLLFVRDKSRSPKIDMLSWFWLPEGSDSRGTSLHLRSRAEGVPYDLWAQQGFLETCSGPEIKYGDVVAKILQLSERFNINSIAFDPYKIEDFKKEMDEQGCNIPMREHAQGQAMTKATNMWMPGSIQAFESSIVNEKLRVNNNPVMNMCIDSVQVRPVGDQGNILFSKQKSPFHIDGATAAAIAFGAMGKRSKKKVSIYEQMAKKREDRQNAGQMA